MINQAAHNDPSVKAYLATFKSEESAFSRFVNASGNSKTTANWSNLRAASLAETQKQPGINLSLPTLRDLVSEFKVWLGCNHRELNKKERTVLIAKFSVYITGAALFSASVVSSISYFMPH